MRLFLAIDLPGKTKQQLDKQLQLLKKEYPHFNWTPLENYHITVHYFGDVDDVQPLIKKIDHAIYDIEQFHLYALNADLFMNQKIVLHIAFNRQKTLEHMVNKIEEAFDSETRNQYVPHLTFARTKIPSKQQYFLLNKKLERMDIEFDFPVKEICLFDSISSGKNPIYKKITVFPLQEK